MRMGRRTMIGVGIAGVLALGAGGIAIAGGGGDDDEAATGPGADRAREAALQHTGGGKVLEAEIADEGQKGYEVEVEKPDGSVVEVTVSEAGKVVATEADDDGGKDDDEGGDDDR
jgi:hypothetical protein